MLLLTPTLGYNTAENHSTSTVNLQTKFMKLGPPFHLTPSDGELNICPMLDN